MTIQQLEYVLAIAREGSITKASQVLFRAQPNISSALKELEEELHIIIFHRTPNGMTLTPQGEKLLHMASFVLQGVEQIKKEFDARHTEQNASIKVSLSRASYCIRALSEWVNTSLDDHHPISLDFHETNTETVIKNVLQGISDLGIIRIPEHRYASYASSLKSKGIEMEALMKFEMKIICRSSHPLAQHASVSLEDLSAYTEILHGDDTHAQRGNRCICVYDRGSQIDLLVNIPGSYMWVSPIPSDMVVDYDMVMLPCSSPSTNYLDLLIFRKQMIGDFIVKDCALFLKEYTQQLVHEPK